MMKKSLLAASFLISLGFAPLAQAGTLPSGFTCTGDCGTLTANGVVTAPPGGSSYQYLSTYGGSYGAGQTNNDGGTNGSLLTTNTFTMNSGDKLSLNFNYVTTDTGYDSNYYPDYAWAALMTSTNKLVGYLFTAQSWNGGSRLDSSVVPSTIATLTQSSNATVTAPNWSPLGNSSGSCWGNGCGYTGWDTVNYTNSTSGSGSFYIEFGVTNVGDMLYDSGLAVANISVASAQGAGGGGGTVPEPWTVALLGSGLLALGLLRRRDLI